MSEAKHIKGDWDLVESLSDYEGQQIMAGDRCIAVTVTQDQAESTEEEKSNARLLVRAPRLLAALEHAEQAMMNARFESGKVDDMNKDRCTTHGRKLYPCNQAVVYATQTALDDIRELIREIEGVV